jgi:hypothetical protein
MSANSCLNIFYRLGDPVMSWGSWPSGSSSFWFCSWGADSPRVPGRPSVGSVFFVCSSCSCSSSFSIRFVFEFWLDEVSDSPQQRRGQSAGRRTVRDHPADSPFFQGSLLDVLLAFSDSPRLRPDSPRLRPDSPPYTCGQSAWLLRTVRPSWPDSPPVPDSFVPWFDSSLLSFVLPRVLQGIVPKTWGWSITSLSWRLVCDSIHRLCVTGICLGFRPGSLRRIFYRLLFTPPSLVAIRSFKVFYKWSSTTWEVN